jgi:hypothetical protein
VIGNWLILQYFQRFLATELGKLNPVGPHAPKQLFQIFVCGIYNLLNGKIFAAQPAPHNHLLSRGT